MRIAMIGTGYVGLVSGACIADFGHHVVCVDKDAGKISALECGEIPIFEPGLKDIVRANVTELRDRPFAVLGLCNDHEVRLIRDQVAKAGPHDWMVVNHQQADSARGTFAG